MNMWIEHLNNPLVLIGFIVFIFSGFIAIFLKKNITFDRNILYNIINKYLKYIFILALIGMVLGVFSQSIIKQETNGKNSPAILSDGDVSIK